MDTTYYHLNTRRVKVSGGADLVTFVPAPVPAPAGEVLDFEACRRKLETKKAWKAMAQAAQTHEPQAVQPSRPRKRRTRELSDMMELCASAAALLVCLCAAFAFLTII